MTLLLVLMITIMTRIGIIERKRRVTINITVIIAAPVTMAKKINDNNKNNNNNNNIFCFFENLVIYFQQFIRSFGVKHLAFILIREKKRKQRTKKNSVVKLNDKKRICLRNFFKAHLFYSKKVFHLYFIYIS